MTVVEILVKHGTIVNTDANAIIANANAIIANANAIIANANAIIANANAIIANANAIIANANAIITKETDNSVEEHNRDLLVAPNLLKVSLSQDAIKFFLIMRLT